MKTTTTANRSGILATVAGIATTALLVAACGGGGSSETDIEAILASTTSDEMCEEVPADAIKDLVEAENQIESAQIGSISCYLSMSNSNGFNPEPLGDVVITNEISLSGSSSFSDVRADLDISFDMSEAITGVGDEAVFHESETRNQLTIGIGDKTLSVSSFTLDAENPPLGLSDLKSIAALTLGTDDT